MPTIFLARWIGVAILALTSVAQVSAQQVSPDSNLRSLAYHSGQSPEELAQARQCSASCCSNGLPTTCGDAVCSEEAVTALADACEDCTATCCEKHGGCGGSEGCLACNHGEQWSLWDTWVSGWCKHGRSSCSSGGVEERESPFHVGGWIQGGYHSESTGLFNNVPDRFNLHQGWLYAERTVDPVERGGIDWGFRVDVMYGVDGQDTQAFGNNPGNWDFDNGFDHGAYAWALPQLYAEIATENLSLKLGHFYTLVGYEVVTAPDNFFYSHAYTMYNTEPFTHTGVLGTWTMSDDVTVYGGWTTGWDTGFDQFGGGSSFLGGVGLQLHEDVAMTYIATAGDFGARGEDAYSHSIVFDVSLTDKLNWIIQSDVLNVGSTNDDDVGLNQYLIYTVNDCIGIGQRVEWWHDDGTSFNAYTLGLNYRPTANLIFRPEYRHDWSPATDLDQSSFGIDVISLF